MYLREINPITWSNAGDRRHRHLLVEFLQNKISQRLSINAQEETSQDLETEFDRDQVTIPDDLLLLIFILLPAQSLLKLQFVCKRWYSLINSSMFVRCHAQAQQSDVVLISQKLILSEPGSVASLNTVQPQFKHKLKSYFHLLDFDNGSDDFIESGVVELVDIRASYDGLILGTTVSSLIMMNPMTRKHTVLPLGTVITNSCDESFGIAFCNATIMYKIVHLFCEKQGKTGCEILSISTRRWTKIQGPPSRFLRYLGQVLVSIGGSLYWLPREHSCGYFVCLNVQDEKFVTKKLPIISGLKDRLVEIGGSLGFVAHAEIDLLQVWILATNDDGSTLNWEKRNSINLSGGVKYLIPICSSRNGKEMVFESLFHHLYVYNFDKDQVRQVLSEDDEDEAWSEWAKSVYIPHRNTLVSWEGSL